MGYKSTSVPAKWMAEMLNNIDGNEVRPGMFNINPTVLDFAVTSVLGGAGRTYLQAFNLPIKLASDEDVQNREVPFWNIFTSAKPENQTTSKFYDTIRKVKLATEEREHYAGDPDMTKKIREEYKAELSLAGRAKMTSARLTEIKKQERLAEKTGNKERAKQLDAQRQVIMNQFNKAYVQGMQ